MGEPIRYIPRKDIDTGKWDDAISRAPNGLVYAYSFYLDTMADQWGALIMGDYETVMPLPSRSKFSIQYVYQPFLCAQLGLFGTDLSPGTLSAFIKAIPRSFRLLELSLNSQNKITEHTTQRNNYVLGLNRPYEQIYSNFSENIQRNIKKAKQEGCIADKDFDEEEVIRLAWSQMRSHDKEATRNLSRFRILYRLMRERSLATTFGIRKPNRELIASCIFFFSQNRAYYILVGNHPDSRTMGASHALIDSFTREYAGKNMILDFEGSDIRSLALFYAGFGARLETYPFLRINRLPFFMRWFKR